MNSGRFPSRFRKNLDQVDLTAKEEAESEREIVQAH